MPSMSQRTVLNRKTPARGPPWPPPGIRVRPQTGPDKSCRRLGTSPITGSPGRQSLPRLLDHLEAESGFQLVEHADQLVDLGVGVRCGHLHPEADVRARDEG